jgi:hypothetical protein
VAEAQGEGVAEALLALLEHRQRLARPAHRLGQLGLLGAWWQGRLRRARRDRPFHQLVLELAGRFDQQLEERLGELWWQACLGAASQVAVKDLRHPPGLHHRDAVLLLVLGDFAADLKALAKQAHDLLVDRVEPIAKALQPLLAHAGTPSSRPLTKASLHSASESSA